MRSSETQKKIRDAPASEGPDLENESLVCNPKAGFGPIGNTEKKVWADYEQLLRTLFFMFSGANFF